jgi:hypothetical protein
VRQAAQEAAFFERCDQPVDAGFRSQIERLLHFVEGGRNARFFDPLVDVEQQFFLFRCQHDLGPKGERYCVLYPFRQVSQVQLG